MPATIEKPKQPADICGTCSHPLSWHHAVAGARLRMCSEWGCKCDLPVREG